jgi:hypothetical protein
MIGVGGGAFGAQAPRLPRLSTHSDASTRKRYFLIATPRVDDEKSKSPVLTMKKYRRSAAIH